MVSAWSQVSTASDGVLQRLPGSFAVDLELEGDVAVAWLSGELDTATVPSLADALATTTATTGQRLVLDVSRLDFVDAAGLGAIVAASEALRSHSGDLRLRAPTPSTTRVLRITGLTALAQFAPHR